MATQNPYGDPAIYPNITPAGTETIQVRQASGANKTFLVSAFFAWIRSSLIALVNTYTKAQGVAPVALTDATSVATDASLSNNFTLTLGGNRTLANPTNLVAGHVYNWIITQDATGSRTLAYGTLFKWPGGTAPVLSTAAGSVDLISAIYDGTRLVANFNKAYA